MSHICPTCGETLPRPPDPEYHEDYTLPGETIVVHEFPGGVTIRIHNAGLTRSGMAAVPVSQLRPTSIRRVGDRGALIVSKWFARRRHWVVG